MVSGPEQDNISHDFSEKHSMEAEDRCLSQSTSTDPVNNVLLNQIPVFAQQFQRIQQGQQQQSTRQNWLSQTVCANPVVSAQPGEKRKLSQTQLEPTESMHANHVPRKKRCG